MSPRSALVAAALAAVVMFSACGGDRAAGPLLEDIAPAVDAVERELGGPQEYFQIVATQEWVELWLARDGATRAQLYLYVDGKLAAPSGQGGEASGSTFTGDDAAAFDEGVLDQVLDDFGDTVEQFVALGTGVEERPVRWAAMIQSEGGGVLEVVLDRSGKVLEAGPLEGLVPVSDQVTGSIAS